MRALITLAILSAVLFGATLFLPMAAWPASAEPTAALLVFLREATVRICVLFAAVFAGPLLLLAWLALPRQDRRSFPVVLILWIAACIIAYVSHRRLGDLILFGLACIPVLLTGEVLRALFTAIVHRATEPEESVALNV